MRLKSQSATELKDFDETRHRGAKSQTLVPATCTEVQNGEKGKIRICEQELTTERRKKAGQRSKMNYCT